MQADGTVHWNRVEDLFHSALELESSERSLFLERNCGDDIALRMEVESLIAFSGKTLDSLKRPVENVAQSLAWQGMGQEIGPYRLTRLLGDGGMGQVYLAERSDHLYEQKVAIKLMHAGLKQTATMLLRFSAERQILANLSHPNIARLLDAGITADSVPYLVMEYIDGLHIDRYCREHNLATHQVLELFLALCSAVEYAHKSLVIHRDIKPANIVVDANGTPRLLDFGIAKLLDADPGNALTRMTERIMTPEYASPEQVRGEPVTTATDVYALGVLLYELLAGRRPFQLEAKSPMEVIRVICDEEPRPPSTLALSEDSSRRPGRPLNLDRDLDNIILMAMRKEPARRYASVSAFSADIQAYLAGYPVHARTDRWSYRSQKFIRRHKTATAAVSLFALALVASSIAMGVLARRAERARLAAQRESQFLNTIFQAATPEGARGKPVMARDLLDQGAKRIDTELAGQPDLQATMLDNVGRAYTAIGQYSQATGLLQRAFEIKRRTLGSDSLDTASTEDALASALRLDGQYAQAEPYFRDSLKVRQRRLGADNTTVAESLSNLGECLYWEDRNAEVEPMLRQALAILRRHNEVAVSSTLDYLALVLERRGGFPEAAELLRDAVDVSRHVNGPDSSTYMVSLHNYAGVLIDSGNLDAAESTERQVLALREKIFGSDHPDLFYALNNLGFILLEKGDWRSAIPILDRGVALARKVGIPAKTANALGNRARAFEEKGDWSAAENDLREALQLVDEPAAQKSWIAAKITAGFGSLAFERGNYAAAITSAQEALEMERALGGEQSPAYASSLIGLGDALLFAGSAPAAESAYRQAVIIRRKHFNPGNPNILFAEIRLGEALTREGNTAEAEPLVRQALDSAHAQPFALPSWRVAEAEFALGACLNTRGQTAKGDAQLRSGQRGLRNHAQAQFRWPAIARALRISGLPAISASPTAETTRN